MLLGLWATGQTINLMTLGGIAAALGLVADDAIVVVENIHRHHQTGVSRHPALTGAGELLPALVGSSLSTVVVFVPFAFLTGIAGAFFKPLALTMVLALAASFAVAAFAVPIATRLVERLAPEKAPEETPEETQAEEPAEEPGRSLRRSRGRTNPRTKTSPQGAAAGAGPSGWCARGRWPSWRSPRSGSPASSSTARSTPTSCRRWTKGRSSSTTGPRPARRSPTPTRCSGRPRR